MTLPGTAWLSRRTLRWKLTAGLVLLLLATCSLIGVVTALELRGFLMDRLDSQLADASGRFSVYLEHEPDERNGGSDGDPDDVPGQAVGTLGARVVGGLVTSVAVVSGNGHASPLRLSAVDRTALAAVHPGHRPQTVHLDGLGDYRVMAQVGREGDVQLTGLPLQQVEETVRRLLTVEVGVFLIVVVVGAAASAALVRWTLRPLNRVAAAALHVSDLPLATGMVELPERDRTMDARTEVGRVSVAFDHMLDHVETALRARNATEQRLRRFIADASHELRTPLATIRSHAEYARRTGDDLSSPVQHALERVEAEAIRMGVLVDDLLLLAQLDAGRPLAREDVDVTRLVLDAVSDARAAGPSHRWRLDLPEEAIEIRGDSHRLHQVLTNLLANARTHTPAGTTVTVALDREGEAVRIDVTDDGPGILPELLPSLFERFTRADDARSRAKGNTGLGLAIAYGIVAAHGGALTVESRPGRTSFRVRLPSGAGGQARRPVQATGAPRQS